MIENIVIFLYLIIFFGIALLVWTFAGYPLFLIMFSSLLRTKHKIDNGYLPKVTMMIMTYNEEKAISKKLDNSFELEYPHELLEIFVVDSASTDKTQEKVHEKIREYYKQYKNMPEELRNIVLIAQPKREGKASGINYGMKHASGDIIIITDGNAMMSKDAIKKMVRHFADRKVGGVCGRFEARDLHNTSTGKGGNMYWQVEKVLRTGESKLDSCIHMSGEITAFRKSLVKELDTSMLSEDFDMAVSIRKKGMRIIYEPNAIAYEPAPTNVEDLKTQKKRIVIGTLQVLFKHKNMLFNPTYGWYGVMILTSHKLFQLLTPFAFLGIFLSSLILGFIEVPGLIHTMLFFKLLTVLLVVGSAYFASTKLLKNFKPIIFLNYFIATNYIIVLGWIDFIKGKKIVTWKKIESSREF